MKQLWLVSLSALLVLATWSCSPRVGPSPNQPGQPDNDIEDIEDPDVDASDFDFDRLFDDNIFKEIIIKISQDEWHRFLSMQHANKNTYGNVSLDEYVKADFHYIDNDGELIIENIGFRNRGNTSIDFIEDDGGNLKLVHWKINFRYQFNGEHPENQGRRGFELKEIDMKYNRNNHPTYMAEAYSMEMFKHFGVLAQETSHALISVEIEGIRHQYGIYTLFEPIDDEFIERRFDNASEDGDLYKSLWQGYGPATLQTITNMSAIGESTLSYHPSYDLKTNKDVLVNKHGALKQFIQNINEKTGEAFKTYIAANFNVDMFLRYLAVNVFLGNPDDYRAMGNNYYLYQDSWTNVWHMIPYDYDHAMAAGWNPTGDYTIGKDVYQWFNVMQELTGNSSYDAILVDKILAINEYKDLYTSYLSEILADDFFTFDHFYERYSITKALYSAYTSNSMSNVGFTRGNSEWYINAKRADVQQQLNQQ